MDICFFYISRNFTIKEMKNYQKVFFAIFFCLNFPVFPLFLLKFFLRLKITNNLNVISRTKRNVKNCFFFNFNLDSLLPNQQKIILLLFYPFSLIFKYQKTSLTEHIFFIILNQSNFSLKLESFLGRFDDLKMLLKTHMD